MIFKAEHIARDVRVALDENNSSEQLIATGDIETLTLDELIGSKIEEGVRRVVRTAPREFLEGGIPFGDCVYWREGFRGWILLPDDFVRLIIFKMSDWERAVFEPISVADPRYALQSSRFGGLRGNAEKPVVAIGRRGEGLALEFFSCRSEDATVDQAMYLAEPRIDRYGGIEIPKRCYTSSIYEIASLTAMAVGKYDESRFLSERGKELLI